MVAVVTSNFVIFEVCHANVFDCFSNVLISQEFLHSKNVSICILCNHGVSPMPEVSYCCSVSWFAPFSVAVVFFR